MDMYHIFFHYISLYIMEYYSAIKKNEIMPFATTWIDLVITILSVVSQKEKQLSPYVKPSFLEE